MASPSQPSGSTPNPLSLKANIKEAYNTISTTYSDWTKPHHATRLKYLNLLLGYLDSDTSNPQSVLELGCGSGSPVTTLLASAQCSNKTNTGNLAPQFKVIGNDISPQQLNRASEALDHFKNVKLIEGDMMDLSFEEESLDAVLGMYSLIHLPREEQSVLLKRIHTWLRPGGYFLGNFAVEELESVLDDNWLGCGMNGGVMFWSSWGKERTCDIMTETGFEVILKEVVQDIEDSDNGEKSEVTFLWVVGRKIERIVASDKR